MSTIVREGRAQRAGPTVRDTRKGYAKSRMAYDKRRRTRRLDSESRAYAAVVRGDVCAYCSTRCGQMAADHIVPLGDGGENAWTNLTGAGRPCNASKKDKPLLLWMLERHVAAR